MLHALVLLIMACVISPTFASENELEVKDWLEKNQCQMNTYLDEAKVLKNEAESKISTFFEEENKNEALTCSKNISQELQENNNKARNSILIFVSLSMPKESLKNLYKEAEQNSLTLTMRGLKNNSFKETAKILQDLGISVQIDPDLFEKYEIKEVPTFIFVKENELLKIKGNVTLSFAKKKFEEEL